MLDVHPPHAPTHTWKDFFIHIATIVVGLLIAVGLEQAVEAIHHRRQVAETREALRFEHEQNLLRYRLMSREFKRQKNALEGNLAALLYLRQHPGATAVQLPQPILWHIFTQRFNDSAWQGAQHSGITALMPSDELTRLAGLYRYQERVAESNAALFQSFALARKYTFEDADASHLSTAQLAEEIELTKSVLIASYNFGTSLRNMALDYTEFSPMPDSRELFDMMHDPQADATVLLVQQNIEQQRLADKLEDPGPALGR